MELWAPEPPAFAVDFDALTEAHAFIRALRGCPQDPEHHAEGDVWIHTRMVLERLVELDDFRSRPASERRIVFWASLLHDVAKPGTTRLEDDGRYHARGHSAKGALLARRILWDLGAPFSSREAIVSLVRRHQVPFFLIDREDRRALAIEISQSARLDHLALVAEADARGRICADAQRLLDNITLCRTFAEEEGCLDAPRAFPSDHARFTYFQNRERSAASPDYRPHEDFKAEVVLMSGLPGAGKDRFVATELAGWPVVSLDALREELEIAPEETQGAVVAAAKERAKEHLRAGRSFVWNATNLSRQLRGPLVRLFADYGARVRIVYVEVPPERLFAQNQARAAKVPDAVLARLLDRWEVPELTEAHQLTWVVDPD